jgi:hypothetical protein
VLCPGHPELSLTSRPHHYFCLLLLSLPRFNDKVRTVVTEIEQLLLPLAWDAHTSTEALTFCSLVCRLVFRTSSNSQTILPVFPPSCGLAPFSACYSSLWASPPFVACCSQVVTYRTVTTVRPRENSDLSNWWKDRQIWQMTALSSTGRKIN